MIELKKQNLEGFIATQRKRVNDELAKMQSFAADHTEFIQEYFADLRD